MSIIDKYKQAYESKTDNVMSMEQFLKAAAKDRTMYASPAERLLKAIGKPKRVDSSKDPRQSRLFGNRVINVYDAFSDFYGLEDVIERVVSFFRHAAQGLEESRQILYLLGPVGSAKSSIAARLRSLMEAEPIYVLADHEGNPSPMNDSPCSLLEPTDSEELGIPESYLKICASPWAVKRLEEYGGDISKFKVLKRFPSGAKQLAISKTEPGDENNQDISALVGKFDIRKLEFFAQDDPDAYRYNGGLCLANQGLMEFVEMFKAPIKVLHPLLTATQEHEYKATEALSPLPFDGIVLAHSNESEWELFKNNKQNEAFLDRVYVVEVPYCLRIDEEVLIYKKLLRNSRLSDAPIAPYTLRYLASFSVATRLEVNNLKPDQVVTKLRVYNGEDMKEQDNHAKKYQEYRDLASKDEGLSGVSTRFAYKVLSETFNADGEEVAADPVHLFYKLELAIKRERLASEVETYYLSLLKEEFEKDYFNKIKHDIQVAYMDSYTEYGQALFDRYVQFADCWLQDTDYRNPDTGQLLDRESLEKELEKIEKPARISNGKDFRQEIVSFVLRYRSTHQGDSPNWKSYAKLREVIEKSLFIKTKDLLPVISFAGDKKDKKKHEEFMKRMMAMGYTRKQVQLVVDWYHRAEHAA